jgi:AraC family transcriptional regulator
LESIGKAARVGGSSAARQGRAIAVRDRGIAACWFPGDPHNEVVSQKFDDHIFVVRLSFGRGDEALLSDRLMPVQWRAGAIEYRPAGADHRHSTAISSDWIMMRLSDDVLDHLVGANQPATTLAPRGPGIVTSSAIAAKAAAIRYFIATAADQPPLAATALVLDLAQACASAITGERDTATPIKLSTAVLRRVVEFIEARIGDPLDIDDLAAVSGKSRFHFAKAFKHATGQSPHAYVVCRRLDRVRRLLSDTDMTIADIAYRTGFASQSHLTKSLKLAIGITPLRYRENFGRNSPRP